MAFQLQVLCIAIMIVCAVLCHAKPQGKLNLLDNAVLQDLNDDHEKYLEFDQDNDLSGPADVCTDNSTNDIFPYPMHASCRAEWTFGIDCQEVSDRLVKQIELWEGPENCEGGGEKCLYKLRTLTRWPIFLLRGTHTTPVAMYVDNFGFKFSQTDFGCYARSYSYSTVPYAVLDYGTNYCNMFNLIDGSGLNKEPGFEEKTCNKICTQYTTADCEVYLK